jgi:3'(2'), 5'-bisphosphate nucleotidase
MDPTSMNGSFDHPQRVALHAVAEAARLCVAVRRAVPQQLEKLDRSPVTVADFGSQALVCRILRREFPRDPIVAEEDSRELQQPEHGEIQAQVVEHVRASVPAATLAEICSWIDAGASRDYSQRFWTLDPIDGTKGFLRNEQYAVSLALIVEGRVALAALACPNLQLAGSDLVGYVFSARRGQGAWCVPLGDLAAAPRAIRVSTTGDSHEARLCESVEAAHSAHDESALVARRLGIAAPSVRMDSQAKYAAVAAGEAEIYLRLPTRADYCEKIWDHAAGVLVVEEAGGKVTDTLGRPLDFAQGSELSSNRGVIATNGALHPRVLAALAP